MKTLIVNADDFGLAECVNNGILDAHRRGIVTSATLMANMPAFGHAVELARAHPTLRLGVHLNLVRGRPVSPPELLTPLLDRDGVFLFKRKTLRAACRREEVAAAAEREYRAQIEKVVAAGIAPTHLDFEAHHALWHPLYVLAVRLAGEYGLAIRNLREPVGRVLRSLPWPGWRPAGNSLLLYLYVSLKHRALRSQARCPDYFFGQSHIGRLDEPFLAALIRHLPEGISELMCHPGQVDQDELQQLAPEIGPSWLHRQRPVEQQALNVPGIKQLIEDKDVTLATFRDIPT